MGEFAESVRKRSETALVDVGKLMPIFCLTAYRSCSSTAMKQTANNKPADITVAYTGARAKK